MPKLFSSLRTKLWIAGVCMLVLVVGALTIPVPTPTAVAPSQERAAPLLEAEVQRREQLRIFEEIQQLGPRLARHSVTIPESLATAPLPSDLAPPAPRVEPAGHGLIISADGEVLTSAGALRGREVLQIQLFDGREVEAHVVAFDPDADLVLLRSDEIPRTEAAPWATTPPTAGMLAVAVSHANQQVAVAPVFVTAAPDVDRRVRTTNADLAPGTPLFTTAGEVFAIAAGPSDASAAIIASAVARLRERIAGGQARRGALGLTFQITDEALRAAFPGEGVLVAEVAPYGPAEAAGIQAGDLITSIGEATVATPDAARAAIAAIQPGATVEVDLLRDRKPMTIVVSASSALGLRVKQTPRAPIGEAPVARSLFTRDALDAHGLLPESRIISINGIRVRTLDDARAQFRRARAPIVLYVDDERGRFFRAVERPS